MSDNQLRMFSGPEVFELKATYGLPLDMAFDQILNEREMTIEWKSFIDAARKNEMWDFQIYRMVEHALQDAGIKKETTGIILSNMQHYMMQNLHPNLKNTAKE